MIYISSDVPFFQFDIFEKFSDCITHFISTRNYLNDTDFTIGLNGFISDSMVINNRSIIGNRFGIDLSAFVFANQVHSDHVCSVDSYNRGMGAFDSHSAIACTDALITNKPDICLVAQAADCVPLLFYDPKNNAVAAVHSGWRGTVAKIAARVVESFVGLYGSIPADLIVGIGPCIGSCCYEVGYDVVECVKRAFADYDSLILHNSRFANPIFDLAKANYSILLESGLYPENIEIANYCSKCNNDKLFSARAGDSGRFGAFIMLR